MRYKLFLDPKVTVGRIGSGDNILINVQNRVLRAVVENFSMTDVIVEELPDGIKVAAFLGSFAGVSA